MSVIPHGNDNRHERKIAGWLINNGKHRCPMGPLQMECSKDKSARRAAANFYEPRGNSPSSSSSPLPKASIYRRNLLENLALAGLD